MKEKALEKAPAIAAMANDPQLGVHVLTEFVFCHRAGLCAYESKDWKDDVEDPSPATYQPSYTLRDIELALATTLNQVAILALIGLFSFAISALLTRYLHADIAYVGMVAVVWFGGAALWKLRMAWILAVTRKQYETAVPSVPDPLLTTSQPVEWWALIKAGFEPIECKDAFLDESWKLAGRPKYILRRESIRIPVWRLRSETDPRTIRRQHQVRMAAYCHLVEKSEGCESPYGVVLFGDSFVGMTVPNSPDNRKALHEAIIEARSVVQRSKGNTMPPEPPAELCQGCPYGEPVPEAAGKVFPREAFVLEVCRSKDADGTVWHCHCGDRFRWLPPHAEKDKKGLKRLD